MNREIKFRAWQKYHKKMLEVLNIGFKDGEVNSVEVKYPKDTIPHVVTYKKNDKKFWLDDDCIKLMQYTGLKDKNGKEIYEGDKLYIGTYSYEEPIDEYEGIVKFDDEMKAFILDGENCCGEKDKYLLSDLITGYYHVDIEVVGNIYENPELLEEGEC